MEREEMKLIQKLKKTQVMQQQKEPRISRTR